MADDTVFETFEADFRQRASQSKFGAKGTGKLELDFDNGALGTAGKLEAGLMKKKTEWAHDFLGTIYPNYSDTLTELYETSKSHSEGPVYKYVITFTKGKIAFSKYLERSPVNSLSDIAKDPHGSYPLMAYRRYFTEELIEASLQGDLRIGQQVLVEHLMQTGQSVPDHHMEFHALNDLISDFYNGGFNQYFSRSVSWDAIKSERKDLYPFIRQALIKLEEDEALTVFEEAVALYAHYHPHVEEGRKLMNIASVPKQEESDVGNRFWSIIDGLEQSTENYMKANKGLFAYH